MTSLLRALALTASLGLLAPPVVAAPAADPGLSAKTSERRPASGWGRTFSGAYLAGRHAERQFDLRSAADQLERALAYDPDNLELVQRVFLLRLSDGRFDDALPLAERLISEEQGLTLALLRVATEHVREGRPAEAHRLVETIPPLRYNAALRPLLMAWLTLPQEGPDAALAALESGTDQRGFQRLLTLHRGLINDVADRPDAAATAYEELLSDGIEPSLRVVQIIADFLERHGKAERGEELREAYRRAQPQSTVLMPSRPAGADAPAPIVADAPGGVAEALFNVAGAYYDDRELAMALVHARLAEGVRPGYAMSTLLIGEILEIQKRHAEAHALYSAIVGSSPFAAALTVRVARSLDQLDRTDDAVGTLETFASEAETGRIDAYLALGHILRGRERFGEAVAAYDRAVAQVGTLEPHHWGLVYARGIALERSGQWDRAQADLEQALELSPDQPYVLNYLGYSWLDRGENLEEAERLVRRAAELRPDDGFIADSVGWAYYVTGRYEEAVTELERAVQLEPGDPTINEHLGDAYWKVGRRIEARFQWSHALRMDPDDKRISKIETKLRCGLDGCSVRAAQGGG
ncbi:MAG: tetratricopeptide repeat protein [Alphaproteobacteria bacterium]